MDAKFRTILARRLVMEIFRMRFDWPQDNVLGLAMMSDDCEVDEDEYVGQRNTDHILEFKALQRDVEHALLALERIGYGLVKLEEMPIGEIDVY